MSSPVLLLALSVALLASAATLIVALFRRGSGTDAAFAARLERLENALGRMEGSVRDEARQTRREGDERDRALREEVNGSVRGLGDSLQAAFSDLSRRLEGRLDLMRQESGEQLEKVRRTVDEQLQGTLEKRLGESFRLVSERLDAVHKGLGEMQTLAAGVGDLKKVLTNVKTRGVWGEVQLEALLQQVLAPEQYVRNARPKRDSRETVEFAIRLPGRGDEPGEVLLPVDAKFPVEDYLRIAEAAERGDAGAVEAASRELDRRVRDEARTISEKYLDPPATTDFAILFLPTEGLYAEVLRRPGLASEVQRDHRVLVAGPTTLAALLNSLQMGFRTLAIEKRSSEVWRVLGEVKTEFGKFGEVLDRVRKKLDEASSAVDDAGKRTRAVDRKLRDVEAVAGAPEGGSAPRLPSGVGDGSADDPAVG